jgi:uncharacterized membrane protein YraQ (UPF0718 family)
MFSPTCSDVGCGCHAPKALTSSFAKAWNYALHEVFGDIAKPMFYGLVLATLFVVLMPKESAPYFAQHWGVAYGFVLLLSLPMYVCSISAIPMALGLLSVGATPGTAFLFLAAAPATNLITAGIIKKILGSRVLGVYLGAIIGTTLLFALLVDFALPPQWFDTIAPLGEETEGVLAEASGALFLGLTALYLFKPYVVRLRRA